MPIRRQLMQSKFSQLNLFLTTFHFNKKETRVIFFFCNYCQFGGKTSNFRLVKVFLVDFYELFEIFDFEVAFDFRLDKGGIKNVVWDSVSFVKNRLDCFCGYPVSGSFIASFLVKFG